MKREPHIREFTAKKGSGLHVHVSTTRNGKKIAIDGGRLYYHEFSSKAECLRTARFIRDDLLNSLKAPAKPKTPTFAQLYDRSFDLLPLAVSTRANYDVIFNAVPELHDTPLNEIDLTDLQTVLNAYANTHTVHRTKKVYSLIRRIYKTAFMLQLPIVDYSAMLALPKSRVPVKPRNTATTYEQLVQFIDAVSFCDSPDAPNVIMVAWVMYYTGMRITEVCGLYTGDIDLTSGIIHVRRAVGCTPLKSAQIVPLKTKRSRRDIPIAPALKPILQNALNNATGELLFSNSDGTPYTGRQLSLFAYNFCRRHNLTFSLYGLRHLFSTDLFRAGVNPKVIQTLMGHENADMSLYYAFTTESEKTAAILARKPS